MKDIHIGAHINTCSLVFTNPIAKYITMNIHVYMLTLRNVKYEIQQTEKAFKLEKQLQIEKSR